MSSHSQSQAPSLSVIVPTYNEASRIARPLAEIARYLESKPYASEIVLVDDGSQDDTREVVARVAVDSPVPMRLASYPVNRGKGFALKVGFDLARNQRIMFTDADLSTPIGHLDDLLRKLDEGADFAIGSRWLPGSQVKVHQPWWRESLGVAFTLLVRLLIVNVSDSTCGFKAFEGAAGKDIFSRSRMPDWSFDAEILLIARLRGYQRAEVAVAWEDREGTKVHVASAAAMSLLGLLRIRANALRGVYDAPLAHDARLQVVELNKPEE